SAFTGATAVKFGSTTAAFSVTNDNTISATAPATITVGTVDITVTTAAGTSPTSANDQYAYTAVTPTVTGIAPGFGSTVGGTTVVVTGTGFTTGSTVAFGATNGTGVVVNSPTSISVSSPAQSAGTVDVTVTNTAGTSAINQPADQFTY